MGINTAIQTSPEGPTGIGFAVPINTAKELLAQFIDNVEVKRPWLGISGMALGPGLADLLDVGTTVGVYVVTVTPGSPAEGVGLKAGGISVDGIPSTAGDIITAVDGRAVTSVEGIVGYFNSLQPGDTVVLTLIRAGQIIQVAVVLGEWPDSLGSSLG